jgi:hypothetical protein
MKLEARSNRLGLFTLFVWCAALLYAALFFYYFAGTAVRAPVYDLLDWLLFYRDRTSNWLDYVWAPHNEHRIVWSRLLVAIDVNWFGGINFPFGAFSLFLLVAMISTLVWRVLKSPLPRRLKEIIVPLLIFLLLPAPLAIMCQMPTIGTFLPTSAFVVFSLIVLTGSPQSNFRLALSLLAAMLAGFSGSGGLLVWPSLVFVAWRSGLNAKRLMFIVLVGGAYTAVYLQGLPTHHDLIAFEHFSKSFDYLIRFLGLPWSHSAALLWPSRIIGFVLLGLGLFLIASGVFCVRETTRLERVGLGLIIFVLFVASAASVTRWNVAPEREMPIRYLTFVILAHVGVVLASLSWLERFTISKAGEVVRPIFALVVLALLVQQVLAGNMAELEAARYNTAWSQFVSGAWTPDMEHYVYPDRERAEAALSYLRQMHIYGQ